MASAYGPPAIDFYGMLSGIGDTLHKRSRESEIREARTRALQGARGPNGVDFGLAALGLIEAGDAEGAKALGSFADAAATRDYRNQSLDLQRRALDKRDTSVLDQVGQRKAAARAMGLDQTNPAYNSFVLTGKMPREDQAPLTATDKKAILEADEAVLQNRAVIDSLDKAEKISPQSHSGLFASQRAWAGNVLPDWLVPDWVASPESSAATANYENLVLGQALNSLKSIFGAAPTEGERKILIELQASVDKPHNVRQKILDRAMRLAQARLDFNERRAAELRGGSFYKPGQGASRPAASPQPAQSAQQPPIQGARQAADGKWYVPDPNRPGKYLLVQ